LPYNYSPIHILGIDKDNTLEDELSALLKPSSYQLFIADSLEEGSFLLNSIDAEVLIISSSLPQEDRINICKKIKTFSKIPILVLSNLGKPGILEQTLNAGADEYLIKPISGKLLTAHLNTLARRFREEKIAGKLREVQGLSTSKDCQS
jgi:DNA-binding response OmpR family regulator